MQIFIGYVTLIFCDVNTSKTRCDLFQKSQDQEKEEVTVNQGCLSGSERVSEDEDLQPDRTAHLQTLPMMLSSQVHGD